jgi:hypothetical protein
VLCDTLLPLRCVVLCECCPSAVRCCRGAVDVVMVLCDVVMVLCNVVRDVQCYGVHEPVVETIDHCRCVGFFRCVRVRVF